MALITCQECSTKVSDQAKVCPQCGAPIPRGVGVGTVVKWILVAFVGYVVYSCSSVMNAVDRADDNKPSSASSSTAPAPPAAPAHQLQLMSWRCEKSYNYAHVKGEVKNISGETLKNVLAVGGLRTKSGELIDSEDTLLDLRTLLPNQTSAFDVMIPDNPQGKNCDVDFKTFRGESISFKAK